MTLRPSLLHLNIQQMAQVHFYNEVETVKQIAHWQSCFQQQAEDVVHNDLNWQNILVNDHNHFWIIDWDDMTVHGDAAMDYSVLLWPLYRSKEWPQLKNSIIPEIDKGARQRMDLYFRAKLLDDVIDVLADYVEAESYPQVKESAQKKAKETHLLAYADYLKLYVNS